MPTVLIIRGYCGAGKSSIAKYLAKKENSAFLEYDTFLWDMNAISKPSKIEYEITFKNLLSVLRNYLKTGKNIVIEGPLVPRSTEDPFDLDKIILIVKKSRYQCKIIQLTAEEKTCVQRMKQRNHIVPKWEHDMFKVKHDKSVRKDEIVIDTSDLTMRQTITRIEQHLRGMKVD